MKKIIIVLATMAGLAGCVNKGPEEPSPLPAKNLLAECQFYIDQDWVSDDPEKQFSYGLIIQPPWEEAGQLFLHYPEHLEYNPVGNTILRHWDKIELPWIISPDRKQASYRVESQELDSVYVESFLRSVDSGTLPFEGSGVRMAMRIINQGQETLPVVRPLICFQYGDLTGFPTKLQENYQHNFIIMDGAITALSDLPTEDIHTTFKGCVVKGCPQHDTRSEKEGGLIEKEMDLALSIITSLDHQRKVIIWWTPGKSMIANANIPCMHADPYFGTLHPGEEVYAEGLIIFTEGELEPIVDYLSGLDLRVF